MSKQPTLLIVDDESGILDTLRILLKKEGFEVTTAQGGKAGLEAIRTGQFDIVLSDVRMPQVTGIDILQAARDQDPTTPVILMTAQASLQTAIGAVNAGAFYYIQKPFANDELLAILRRAAEFRSVRVENKQLKQEIKRRDRGGSTRPIGKSKRFLDAVLETQGLTGLARINLTGGSREAPPRQAAAGQEYPVIKTGPSLFFRLDEAMSRLLSEKGLTKLLTDLDVLAKGASEVVDEENRVRLKQTLKDLSEVAQTIAAHKDQLDRGLTGAERSADNLAKMTLSLNEQVPLLLARINKSALSLQRLTDELAVTSKAVGALVNETKPEVEQFSRQTLPESSLLVSELRQLTGPLNRVVRDLEREPNALVFGKQAQRRGPGE